MALVSNPLGDPYVLGVSDSFDIAPPASEFRVQTYLLGYIKKHLYDLFKVYDFPLIKRTKKKFSTFEINRI